MAAAPDAHASVPTPPASGGLDVLGPPPAPPAPLKRLTKEERIFVDYYVSRGGPGYGPKAVRAAGLEREGYEARYTARDMLDKPHIKNAVKMARAAIAKRLAPTKENIIDAYSRLALADRRLAFHPDTGEPIPPHELPQEFSGAVKGYDAEKRKLDLLSPEKSLDALAKIAGMFEEDNRQQGAATAEVLREHSDIEIARRFAYILNKGTKRIAAQAEEETA